MYTWGCFNTAGRSPLCWKINRTVWRIKGISGRKDRILEDLNAHAENLVLDTFVKKNNQDIHDNHLSTLVGSVISKIKATFKFDSDGDNIKDKEWTVYTNATYTEKDILISP